MRTTLLVVCAAAVALAGACPPAPSRPGPAAIAAAPLPMLPRRRQFLVRAPQQHADYARHNNDIVYEFNVFADDYGAG